MTPERRLEKISEVVEWMDSEQVTGNCGWNPFHLRRVLFYYKNAFDFIRALTRK